MPRRLPLFATTTRGTEDLLAEELTELGASKVRQDRGGVRFLANLDEALRICLWTRIAMRVLYPLGEFASKGAEGLYDAAASVPWEEHFTSDSTFMVEATLKNSEHTHSGFVGLKIKDAIVDRLRAKLGSRPDVDTRDPILRVVAHLAKEKLSLSLDLCGEPLHRRRYRVSPTVAPLKETLAAAVLRAAKYTGAEPLVDPMCGSGTLAIEAGLIAVRRAPGLTRAFAVERWPHLGAEARGKMEALRDEARANERQAPHPIYGFDRDEEALDAARKNVAAANLTQEVHIVGADATGPMPIPTDSSGLLVTNPPYGDRLKAGGQKGMKTFYYQIGESFRRLAGWRMAILSGNEAFESAFHMRPSGKRKLWNGPIACELLSYRASAPAVDIPPE
jgi:23S rRNA (guanine2445-N2)-methyltransferase / 23S rRNA (guanine2069-N7)-methyltransferase